MPRELVAIALLLAPLLLAGCLAPAATPPPEGQAAQEAGAGAAGVAPPANRTVEAPRGTAGVAAAPVRFTEPVVLNRDGDGFEPGVTVGPDGAVYVSAHRSRVASEGGRVASFLWHSRDGGATWREMPTPAGAGRHVHDVEGDLAVDAAGRVYFAATNAADSSLTRWAPGPQGPRWEWTRPVTGTTGLDDRPWLAAHGDGVLYYLGSNRASLPAPDAAAGGAPTNGSDAWIYASEDGGIKWSLGRGFPGSLPFCGLAASPADDRTVLVACHRERAGRGDVAAYVSRDRGATWSATALAARAAAPRLFHIAAAVDRGGAAYVAWVDDARDDREPGALRLARHAPGGPWDTLDVTPFNGTFDEVWVSAGDAGTVAVTFYATASVPPGDDSEWFPYLLLSANASGPDPSWALVRLLEAPASVGAYPPFEFFQSAVGPGNAVHVVVQRAHDRPPLTDVAWCCSQVRQDLLFLRQVAGPNLPAVAGGDHPGAGGDASGRWRDG